ncbi:hypothetical protein GNP94_21970 [Paenibacillus campinasensis]|uniref:Uncharacterized protein n=1 Tax=Paenibacillus campinasensis TaxID=66347 RepID=A0ABW9TAJ4_9BACL|nr:hypothetical protein [Paenibacillus campinasensis]MUG68641.1 hypothetical protein [Paenibacillus campinasensis]
MANFKQKKIKTKSGKEYTLQHPGVRMVTKIVDRTKNKHGVTSDERLGDEMLQHIVVDPKLKMENFDDYAEYFEVINEAYLFMTGQDEKDGEDNDDQ